MEGNIELSFLSAEQQQALVDDPFRDEAVAPEPDAGYDEHASRRRGVSSESSNSVSSPPQQIRSMLDV